MESYIYLCVKLYTPVGGENDYLLLAERLKRVRFLHWAGYFPSMGSLKGHTIEDVVIGASVSFLYLYKPIISLKATL